VSDWNTNVITEFRANDGQVGGPFAGAPMVLLHHRGRKTGRDLVAPMMYLPHETDDDIIYVFASKAGAPTHPDWYRNLVAAGRTAGRQFAVCTVTSMNYTLAQVRRRGRGTGRDLVSPMMYPAHETAGIRTIPVLELTRAR